MDNFERVKSYDDFCNEIKSTNRHFLSKKASDFLEWLYKITLEYHNHPLKKESTYVYRARVGAEYPECLKSHESGDGKETEWVEPNGYIYPRSCSSDYFPISGRLGSGGRANPEGIAFLYVASTPEIAISEVRPFINDDVSVALMRLKRDLKVADFSTVSDGINFSLAKYHKETADKLSQSKVIDSVIRDVSNAFSRPVFEQNKTIDYLPTQVIAEYFHSKGFDGIGFRSQFETAQYNKDRDDSFGEISVKKEGGYNLVVFNKDDFYVHSASVYRMKKTLNFIEQKKVPNYNFENTQALDIQSVREYFGMNQDIFAYHIGADYRDLVNWEAGVSRPKGTHFKILKMLEENPETTMAMLKKC